MSTLAVAADEKPAAGEKPRRDPAEAFKKFDTNSDGNLDLEEFKASPAGKRDPSKAEELFKKRDTNADGKISLEEWTAGRPKKADK
jgi:Ca2+-binding EF-hand superfamily protein